MIIIIPFDTSNLHGIYYFLLANDQLSIFSYLWFVKHQSELQLIKNLNSLNPYFDNNKEWWQDLSEYYANKHIDLSKATDNDKMKLKTYLKAFVAHVVLNKSIATKIVNEDDPTFVKAIHNFK